MVGSLFPKTICMFKKMSLIICYLFPVLLCMACGGDGSDNGSDLNTITLGSNSLNFNCGAEAQTVSIATNHEWAATASDAWISVNPKYSTDQNTELTISVQANTKHDGREGSVTLVAGTARASIAVAQAGDATAPDPSVITCPLPGYSLVWHDEFDEGVVLGDDWTHEVQNAGWVNNELQNYVAGSADGKRVTELVDGKLNIHCFKGSDRKVYSGRVYAKVNSGWKYGYFEARILLPKGKGTWPAFWMMPVGNDWNTNPWPMCGEIDIMEEVGVVPNEVSSSIHTQDYNHTKGTQKTHAMTIDKAEGEFHVYALEWTEDAITTYVDGEVQLAVTKQQLGTGHNQWPFHYAFYPILNLAWGGDWGGMNGVDESALPITMKVDYLRVFQKKD